MKMKTATMFALGALLLSACDGESSAQKAIGTALDTWTAQPDGDGAVMGEFKKDFPNAWSKMRSDLEVNYANSGNVKSAHTDALAQLNAFMKSRTASMAKAPDADLAALFDEQNTLLNEIWTPATMETCAHMASVGLQSGEDVGSHQADAYADQRLQLKTMKAAADHPTTHKPFAWTPAEQARIDQMFSADNIKVNTPKEGISGADYVVQCVAVVDMNKIVKDFPVGRKADYEAGQITKRAAAAAAS
jgi:hypothetical protein